MNEPLPIRRAAIEDLPHLRRLVAQLGHPIDLDAAERVMAGLLTDPAHRVLVAHDADSIAGFANLNLRPQLHHAGVVGTIDEMVVDQERRGHGVGRLLVVAALEDARHAEADAVDVITGRRREEAVRFYEANGFEMSGHMLVCRLREH